MTHPMKTPPRLITGNDLIYHPRFAYGDQAQIAEISGTGDGTKLGTGFVAMSDAEIPWTVQYDEMLLVLEGTITVRTDQGDLVAGPRESIWLPAGTKLTYIAKRALVFYAIEPANWADAT